MYVTLLSGALEAWDTDLDYEILLDHVRDCRAALPSGDPGVGADSTTALAAEVAYDRALVCLATRHGIDVTPKNFTQPRIERDRLEREIAHLGVDLREAPVDCRSGPGDA